MTLGEAFALGLLMCLIFIFGFAAGTDIQKSKHCDTQQGAYINGSCYKADLLPMP